MAQDAYTGVQGTVEYAGSTIAVAEFSIKIKRGVASHPRSGKWSDYKLPGKVDVTGSITRILVDGELLAALLNATPATGAAETLKTGVDANADGYTAMTDTSIASASRVRATVATSAITTTGHLTIMGADTNGNPMEETIDIGLLGVAEYATSTKVFKTVYGVYVRDIRSTGSGTLTIASITGDSSVNVGEPKVFNLIGKVDDGSNHVYITANNCFFTDGEFAFANADKMLSDKLSFTMRDPDSDLTVEYVNA